MKLHHLIFLFLCSQFSHATEINESPSVKMLTGWPLDLPVLQWCSDPFEVWDKPGFAATGLIESVEAETVPLVYMAWARCFTLGPDGVRGTKGTEYGIVSSPLWNHSPVSAAFYHAGHAYFTEHSDFTKNGLPHLVIADLFCFRADTDVAHLLAHAPNVKTLILPWVGLNKFDPSSLPENIEHLFLYNTGLSQSAFEGLKRLTKLKTLHLRGCTLAFEANFKPSYSDLMNREVTSEFWLPHLKDLDVASNDVPLVAQFCGSKFSQLEKVSLEHLAWFLRPQHRGEGVRQVFPKLKTVDYIPSLHVKPADAYESTKKNVSRQFKGVTDLEFRVRCFDSK